MPSVSWDASYKAKFGDCNCVPEDFSAFPRTFRRLGPWLPDAIKAWYLRLRLAFPNLPDAKVSTGFDVRDAGEPPEEGAGRLNCGLELGTGGGPLKGLFPWPCSKLETFSLLKFCLLFSPLLSANNWINSAPWKCQIWEKTGTPTISEIYQVWNTKKRLREQHFGLHFKWLNLWLSITSFLSYYFKNI